MRKLNLQKFAFPVADFDDGDVATGAQAIQVLLADETGTYTEICLTSFKETPGMTMETFYEICRNGFPTKKVTGYEPVFEIEAMLHKGYAMGKLWHKRYSPKDVQNLKLKVNNTLINEQILFTATFSEPTLEAKAENFMTIKGKFSADGEVEVKDKIDDVVLTAEVTNISITVGTATTYQDIYDQANITATMNGVDSKDKVQPVGHTMDETFDTTTAGVTKDVTFVLETESIKITVNVVSET